MQFLERINSLPRRSHERAITFQEMHNELDEAARSSPAIARWQEKIQETRRREREEQTLFDREQFYALQPRERLQRIIDIYAHEFAR